MTEREIMVRDIYEFVWGKMGWESAIDLLSRISKSEKWIDYLLMEMELFELFNGKEESCFHNLTEIESIPSEKIVGF